MTNPPKPNPSAAVKTQPPLVASAPTDRLLAHHKAVVDEVMSHFEAPAGTVATASAGGVFVDGLRSFVESVARACLNSFAKNIGAGTPDHILETLRASAVRIAREAAEAWFNSITQAKAKDPAGGGGA
jgi:hypothetical protein